MITKIIRIITTRNDLYVEGGGKYLKVADSQSPHVNPMSKPSKASGNNITNEALIGACYLPAGIGSMGSSSKKI
jgi:hypothetical protein